MPIHRGTPVAVHHPPALSATTYYRCIRSASLARCLACKRRFCFVAMEKEAIKKTTMSSSNRTKAENLRGEPRVRSRPAADVGLRAACHPLSQLWNVGYVSATSAPMPSVAFSGECQQRTSRRMPLLLQYGRNCAGVPTVEGAVVAGGARAGRVAALGAAHHLIARARHARRKRYARLLLRRGRRVRVDDWSHGRSPLPRKAARRKNRRA